MGNPRYRNGNARRRARQRWKAQGLPCCICGRRIDYTLQAPDPLSFVVDETVALARGGTLTYDNQGPAHWWCNRIKSTHSLAWAREKVRRLIASGDSPFTTPQPQPVVRSSDWFGQGE